MTMTREASTTAAAVPTRLELGGNANFLIAAARLGLRTAAVAHVGGDSVGEFAARELEREGVEVMRPPLLGRGVEVSESDGGDGDGGEASASSSSTSSSVLLGREDTLVCYVLTHAESASHAFCSAYDLGPHPLLVSSSSSSSSLSSLASSSSEVDSEEREPQNASDDDAPSSSSPSAQHNHSNHPLLPQSALDILSSTKAVFVNGFAFDELPAGTVLAALEAARAAGAAVFFDPGPRVAAMLSSAHSSSSPDSRPSNDNNPDFYSTALEAALDAADVVLLTEEEAEAATGCAVAGLGSDAAAAAARAILLGRRERESESGSMGKGSRRRRSRRTSAVVVKRGAKGAVAVAVVAAAAGGGGKE